MRFVGQLIRRQVLSVAIAAAVAWYLVEQVFDLTEPQQLRLRLALPVLAAFQCVLVAAFTLLSSRRLRGALRQGSGVPEPVAVAAAVSGHRLPALLAIATVAIGSAGTLAVVAFLARRGMPGDLAVATAGIGFAATLLAAMLGYAWSISTAAHAIEALGPRADLGVRGTVRGKILALGLGINTVAFLLLAPAGYARHRADAEAEYVRSAERGQESAIASGPADPELPRRVWLATGAPTLLFSPSGAVVAHFGGDLPALAGPGALGAEPLREPAGWIVRARAPSGGLLVSWLPEDRLRERWSGFWGHLAQLAVVVYGAGAVLAWVAARAITVPFRTLGRAADRIAAGDLTATPATVSRDELGQLAADFRRMAQGLKALVMDVQTASEGVSLGAREAGAIGERVRSGALDQLQGVVAMKGAVEAMESSVAQVSRGMGGLAEYVAATNAAMGEMASALEEVRDKGAELERAMQGALRDVDHLADAGREADATLGELGQVAGHASGTLSGVKASLTALERAAAESESNAALVAEVAQRAGGVVEETVHGMEAVRAAVSDAQRRITALGRRSDDVHQVVDFISEVAGRTNLLSLNASIIASQAGEHGKAFAVVADQIRELASQIARSTKSIGDIIQAVREEVEASAALIDRGDRLAAEGLQLARNSLEALVQIQRVTQQGKEAAGAIGGAVGAHAASSREVAQVVESVADGSRAVGAAVQLVGRSVAGVGSVSRGVQAVADQVARALDEQSARGRRHVESISRLERMVGEIARAVHSHDVATRRVRDALGTLSETAGSHESAVEGLAGVAERLGARAQALAERVGRFKI
jgi:methyl-accepting chemotaxis protein